MAHEALVTNSWRKRHMSDSDLCPICGAEEETVIHMLCDCPRLVNLWKNLAGGAVPYDNFFVEDINKLMS